MMKRFWPWMIIAGVCAFHLVANILWLSLDKTPPAWDQAAHIRSVALVNQWLSGSFWGGFSDLIRAFGGYPPLIYLIGGAWSLLVGLGIVQISFLNTLFLMMAIAGVYLAVKEVLSDKKIALITAISFSFVPVIYDISRNFLLDLPLLVWTIWGFFFLIKSGDLGKNKWTIGWWVALMLASLTKLNGFIYFAPMGLWAIYVNIRRKDTDAFAWMFLGGTIYTCAVGWWWILNGQNIYQYITGLAGQGEKATDPMDLTSWLTWIHYFKLMFLHQLSPIPTLFMVYGLYVWKGLKIDKNKKMMTTLFVVMNYVVFTIIKNKDFRFTLPLLPFAALGVVLAVEKVWNKGLIIQTLTAGKILTGLLVLFMGFNFVENSFGWPVKKDVLITTSSFLLGDIEWIGWDNYPVRAPGSFVWPQPKILADLEKESLSQGKKLRILTLINKEEVNDNNLAMYKELMTTNSFEPGSVGGRSEFKDEKEIRDYIKQFDGVLVAQKDFDPAPFYGINLQAYRQARDYVWENQGNFQLIDSYTIYGDKKLFLYRNAFVD